MERIVLMEKNKRLTLERARELAQEMNGKVILGAQGYCATNDEWYIKYCIDHGGAKLVC